MSFQAALPISMIPGDSVLHRINPLAKIVWVVGYIVLAFSTRNLVILYGLALFAAVLVPVAGVTRPLSRAALIILPIGSSLIFLQGVAPAVAQPWTPIADLGPLTIYQEGIYTGLVLLGRVVAALILTLVVVMTTHPSDMFTSLSKLRVPYTLNFMLAMTLQLIPILQRELAIIMSAQRSRGMKGRGFGAVLPSFVPVFVGSIERVQQLSISLESRGFGSHGVKTSFRQVRSRPADWVIGGAGAVVLLGLTAAAISRGGWDLSAQMAFSPQVAVALVGTAALIFLSIVSVTLFFMFRR